MNDKQSGPAVAASPVPSAARRYGRLLVGTLLSLIFIVLALRDVPLDQVVATLLKANVAWVVIALVCVNLANLAKAWRWQVILQPQAPHLGVTRLFAVFMIGQGMNTFAPLRVGDVARAYMLPGVSVGAVLYSVVIEKALDSLALLGLIAAVAIFMPLPGWLKQSGIILSLALVSLLAVLILAGRGSRHVERAGAWLEHTLPAARRFDLARRLRQASQLMQTLGDRRVLLKLALWTALAWFLGALVNYLTLLAVGLVVPQAALASCFLLVVLYLGAIVPSSPGKVGVFHYLVVISLALFGTGKGEALAYAVLLHLIVYGPTAVLGAYYIWRESQRRSEHRSG